MKTERKIPLNVKKDPKALNELRKEELDCLFSRHDILLERVKKADEEAEIEFAILANKLEIYNKKLKEVKCEEVKK